MKGEKRWWCAKKTQQHALCTHDALKESDQYLGIEEHPWEEKSNNYFFGMYDLCLSLCEEATLLGNPVIMMREKEKKGYSF